MRRYVNTKFKFLECVLHCYVEIRRVLVDPSEMCNNRPEVHIDGKIKLAPKTTG